MENRVWEKIKQNLEKIKTDFIGSETCRSQVKFMFVSYCVLIFVAGTQEGRQRVALLLQLWALNVQRMKKALHHHQFPSAIYSLSTLTLINTSQ